MWQPIGASDRIWRVIDLRPPLSEEVWGVRSPAQVSTTKIVTDLRPPLFPQGGRGGYAPAAEAEEGFGVGDVGEAEFAVFGGEFQSVTICHRLIAFLSLFLRTFH